MEQLDGLLDCGDVALDDDTLDRIDKLVPPGTNVNRGESGWVPPAFAQSWRRRRPVGIALTARAVTTSGADRRPAFRPGVTRACDAASEGMRGSEEKRGSGRPPRRVRRSRAARRRVLTHGCPGAAAMLTTKHPVEVDAAEGHVRRVLHRQRDRAVEAAGREPGELAAAEQRAPQPAVGVERRAVGTPSSALVSPKTDRGPTLPVVGS